MAALLREVGTYLDNFSVFQVGLLSLQLRTSLCLITEEGGHRLFGCILGSLDTNFLDLRFVGDGSSHLGSLFGVYVPKVGLGHSGGVSLRRGLRLSCSRGKSQPAIGTYGLYGWVVNERVITSKVITR